MRLLSEILPVKGNAEVIGRDDLIEHVPVIWNKDQKILVTQFDGKHIESVGMLKMDLFSTLSDNAANPLPDSLHQSIRMDGSILGENHNSDIP